jgi:hypothetical protein
MQPRPQSRVNVSTSTSSAVAPRRVRAERHYHERDDVTSDPAVMAAWDVRP